MTDAHDPTQDLPAQDPRDALLADLLKALDTEGVVRPGPDAGRVAGHLAGVGDVDLLEDAARDPSVRRLLAEIVREVPLAERDAERGQDSGHGGPSAAVREAALAAWPDVAPARDAVRASARSPIPFARLAAAAALVILPLAGWWLLRSPDDGLAVEAIERVSADGAVSAEGPGRLAVGAAVRAAPGEFVALRLAGGGRIVVRGDAAAPESARVACAPSGTDRCERVGVALAQGGALVAAPLDPATESTLVLLPDGSRLEMLAGAALVAVDGDRAGVELDDAGRGRFTPRGGATPELVGPGARRLLGPEGSSDPVRAVLQFRDLRRFDEAPRPEAVERFVGARQWRVASGPVGGVSRASAAGMPALSFDLPAGGEARLAWRPDDGAASADKAVVRLLATVRPRRGAAPGPETARLRFSLVGVPGAEGVLDVTHDPDPHRVEIPLPPGWAANGGEAVLRIAAEGAVEANVLGVAFPSPFPLGTLARAP